MKKYLVIIFLIIIGVSMYISYLYFIKPSISVENVNGQSITIKYSNLSPSTRVALVDNNGNFWALEWTPQLSSDTTSVTAEKGTPLWTYFLRATNADMTKTMAESKPFSLGEAGNPTASIDQQSLISSSVTPTLSGSANVYDVWVVVEISGRQVYSEEADVINGYWQATLPKVEEGDYIVKIYDENMNLLTSGSLLIANK